MIRRNSSSVVRLVKPAARTTFSSSITEPTSLPPKRRPSWQTFSPCVTQLDCTFRKFVRNRREMARFFRYSTAVASSHLRPPRAVFCHAACFFVYFVDRVGGVGGFFVFPPAPKLWGGGGAHPKLVRGAMPVE